MLLQFLTVLEHLDRSRDLLTKTEVIGSQRCSRAFVPARGPRRYADLTLLHWPCQTPAESAAFYQGLETARQVRGVQRSGQA